MSLVPLNNQLPITIEDLTKFVLVGREKLNSVRAEIRAIDKLNLAQEVRDQKRDEARMLSEALLDAEVRLGELLKEIPKQLGGRPSEETMPIGGQSLIRPKGEVIKDLGFDRHQVQRFETLASNKDLVEQVKEEARQNDDIPTRSRVLDLAKKRDQLLEQQQSDNEAEEDRKYNSYLNFCEKTANDFVDAIYTFMNLNVSDEYLAAWKELLDSQTFIQGNIDNVEIVLSKLLKIKRFLRGLKK